MSMYGMLTPIKLGVRFEPPAIILVYRERDVTLYAGKFKTESKYKKFFERVSQNKLEKIVFILQDNMKGYTLAESVERAKKFNTESKPEESEVSESIPNVKDKKNAIDDYDDDDFHDTDDDENDKNMLTKSVSTLEEVKAATAKKGNPMSDSLEIEELLGTLNLPSPQTSNEKARDKEYNSKLDSLNLLSTQMKSVKSGFYDFEDSADSESEEDGDKKEEEIIEEVLETADKSESDESF